MIERDKKFTPGPWSKSTLYCDGADPLDQNGFSVADIPLIQIKEDHPDDKHWSESRDFYRELSQTEFMANANLIAAAPELLEALEEALKLINSTSYSGMATAQEIEAAIAKAYGENHG